MLLVVYSKNNCPQCDKAKHIFKSKGIAFDEVKIDENAEARDWLIEQGHKSAPQIYLNGDLFVEGGYQGLAKLSDDELFNKLGDARVSN